MPTKDAHILSISTSGVKEFNKLLESNGFADFYEL